MTTRIVNAAEATGYNMSLAQLFGSGPKWTIRCGSCGGTFTCRIPMISDPTVPCSYCGVLNRLPLTVS